MHVSSRQHYKFSKKIMTRFVKLLTDIKQKLKVIASAAYYNPSL